MTRLKTKLKVLAIAAAITGLSSCSFQSDSYTKEMSIRDISHQTGYADIIRQGYMGGSVIYNETDKSLGQLANGVTVAIRLSKANRKIISDTEAVFGERENSAIYGTITVNSISCDSITFESNLYNIDGNIYSKKSFTLAKNSEADIDGDGLADIKYCAPVQKRAGYEKSMYLNFLSSQEDLNITMFALLKDQYPGKTYPNGIVGVTPENKFIVQKYVDADSGQRSVVSGMYKGDYVIDSVNGKYQIVMNNQYARSARSVSDADLVDIEEDIDLDGAFNFTDADFAFMSAQDLLNVLPDSITDKYTLYAAGIDKLNAILEDKDLIKIICDEQETILTKEEQESIFSQVDLLSTAEVIQLNRLFLEQNYPVSCPQRLSVSTAITQILPLTSVVFTEDTLEPEIMIEESEEDASRAASFVTYKTKASYDSQLAALQKDFDTYKTMMTFSDFEIPLPKKSNEKGNVTFESKLKLNNSKVSIGIKGSFSNTWGSVKSSLGAAVLFKAEANIDVNLAVKTKVNNTLVNVQGTTSSTIKGDEITIPVVKETVNLYEFKINKDYNIARFTIGPVLIGIGVDLTIGLPINMNVELNTNVKYDAYMAGEMKVGVSAGLDYGIKWKKKWFIKYPAPYANFSSGKSSDIKAIFFVSPDLSTLKGTVDSIAVGISFEPYVKAGIYLSVYEIVRAGFSGTLGLNAYTKVKFAKPNLTGYYGLKYSAFISADLFVGLKGVKILGINIGTIGKNWSWDIVGVKNKDIIKETKLFEYKL